MYGDLVKRLRNCTSDTVEDCAECPYQGGYKGTYCMNGLIEEAADAIEKLSGLVDHYGGEAGIKDLQEFAGKYWDTLAKIPRWIPVTERLPEESEGLRWHEDLIIRFTSVWCCNVNIGTIEVRYRLQHKKTGIDYLDQHMKDTNWHWSNMFWEPTHWMPIVPLPEPPKEKI